MSISSIKHRFLALSKSFGSYQSEMQASSSQVPANTALSKSQELYVFLNATTGLLCEKKQKDGEGPLVIVGQKTRDLDSWSRRFKMLFIQHPHKSRHPIDIHPFNPYYLLNMYSKAYIALVLAAILAVLSAATALPTATAPLADGETPDSVTILHKCPPGFTRCNPAGGAVGGCCELA
ncbi:hypothetical protein BGX24_009581 [Mortierella sp. AD032]|nr:hypothetical protein BGX24_009581 [Mortierella sp. AD032]